MKKVIKDSEFRDLLKAVKRQAEMDPNFEMTFAVDALPNEAYKRAKAEQVRKFYLTA